VWGFTCILPYVVMSWYLMKHRNNLIHLPVTS
jgi:hypothetical protein